MKNAKKSMFITTILMVAVLIVAVSTATFAWYTASSTGTATDAVVTAANSSSANIAIGWTSDAETITIPLTTQDGVAPMVPKALPTADMAYDDLDFKTTTIDTAGKMGAITDTNTYWEVENSNDTNNPNAFFVVNRNINNGVNVSLTCDIDESTENASRLLVAVFVDGQLKSIFTNAAKYIVGDFAIPEGGGQEVATLMVTGADYTLLPEATALINQDITFALTAHGTTGNSAKIQVKAWLDGEALTESYANKSAGFSFTVSEAQA